MWHLHTCDPHGSHFLCSPYSSVPSPQTSPPLPVTQYHSVLHPASPSHLSIQVHCLIHSAAFTVFTSLTFTGRPPHGSQIIANDWGHWADSNPRYTRSIKKGRHYSQKDKWTDHFRAKPQVYPKNAVQRSGKATSICCRESKNAVQRSNFRIFEKRHTDELRTCTPFPLPYESTGREFQFAFNISFHIYPASAKVEHITVSHVHAPKESELLEYDMWNVSALCILLGKWESLIFWAVFALEKAQSMKACCVFTRSIVWRSEPSCFQLFFVIHSLVFLSLFI